MLKQTKQEVFSRALCTELLGNLPAADFCAGNNYVDYHTATYVSVLLSVYFVSVPGEGVFFFSLSEKSTAPPNKRVLTMHQLYRKNK